ncbi:MAG: methyltransferase domain-containing protein [Proteobacteria bacterium]|nr:methyltransferase domain-containing protein [Pseudomonadota bacterium]
MQGIVRGLLTALLLGAMAVPALALEEVPYVQTPDRVVEGMLDLAAVRSGDYLIDLGSGDGRIVITAALKRGTRGLGVEIDPRLVEKSRAAAKQLGVEARAGFVEQDLFATDIRSANVLTMYLLPDVNLALRPRILAEMKPGSRVVSHDWDMGEWKPDMSVTLDVPEKKIGLKKTSTLHLWMVPARIAGTWRTRVPLASTRGPMEIELELEQKFQEIGGRAKTGGRVLPVERGFVHGELLFFRFGEGAEALLFKGRAGNGRIVGRITDAQGNEYPWRALREGPAAQAAAK